MEFHLDTERDKDHGKIGATAKVSGVVGGNLADTIAAELRAKFGVYTEARGGDISEALNLKHLN